MQEVGPCGKYQKLRGEGMKSVWISCDISDDRHKVKELFW